MTREHQNEPNKNIEKPAISQFIEKVNSQIKSKEAQNFVRQELTGHMEETSLLLQERGQTKKTADENAVKQMGNPIVLGKDLHQLHKPKTDWTMLTLFLVIIVFSFFPFLAKDDTYIQHLFRVNAIHSLFFIPVVIGLLFFDYRKLQRFGLSLYVTACLLTIFLVQFGIMVNGRPMGIVISESIVRVDPLFILLLLFFAWASFLNKQNGNISLFGEARLFVLFWIPIFLFALAPYYVVAIMYFITITGMITFSSIGKKIKLRFFTINVTLVTLLSTTLLLYTFPQHILDRFAFFFNKNANQDLGLSFIYDIITQALSQTGWLGNGLNTGFHRYLPESQTDFVFPYLVYTFGWLFGIILIAILLLFAIRMGNAARKTPDTYGKLLVIGGLMMFSFPLVYNLMMALGYLPFLGISLPFISYGGSNGLFYSIITGLILSVYRRKDLIPSFSGKS